MSTDAPAEHKIDTLSQTFIFAGSKAFYRPQSCFSRDLAVLSAVVHRRQQQQQQQDGAASAPLPPLHVCDAMAGSGIRSMRYLVQAEADYGEPAAMDAERT